LRKLGLNNCAIYDEVLSQEDFASLWKWVQEDNYTGAHSNEWLKVWRLSDSPPMGGTSFYLSKAPFSNPIDKLLPKVLQMAEDSRDMIGKRGEKWNEISIKSYIYPRGTKLSWHNDSGYEAACIFYTHPKWSSSWGGELFIAETDKNFEKECFEEKLKIGPLEKEYVDAILEDKGVGRYVHSKPNRAVLTPAPIWHTVNRVDADAGDNCRCSIVFFFKKIKS
jgi:hypothetical protein